MKKKTIEALNVYSKSFFVLLLCFMLIRITEFSLFHFLLNQDIPWELLLSQSINLDIIYLGFVSLLGLILFLLLNLLNNKLSKVFIFIWSFFLILIQVILTQFHLTNQTLLSSVVFEFSFNELVGIASSELVLSKLTFYICWILILLIGIVLIYRVINNNTNKNNRFIGSLLFAIILINSLINISYAYKPIKKFNSIREFLFSNSKPIFLYQSFQSNKQVTLDSYEEIAKEVLTFQQTDFNKKYIDIEYPLIYKIEDKNVLGSYFKKSSKAPSIVVVISESLSSSFSVAATGLNGNSLTPFTDSLANEGLYWENFFSNAPRSYGSLPNLLASLPPSTNERGIINSKNKSGQPNYPVHESLVSILKKNNYYTNHTYPSWSGFDHTKSFMDSLGIDNFIDETNFDTLAYPRYGGWGFSDLELYKKGLDVLEAKKNKQSTLSIFQTIALHSPFDMVEPSYYDKTYLENKLESLNLKDTSKGISKLNYKQLATIFASDDALKYLFNRIKNTDSYENTIFVITGDHALDTKLTDYPLRQYHIPLIIYSPLLKKSQKFKGVCSHVDFTPSLLALLEGNFGVELPEQAHWIGNGLDTSTNFVSKNTFPLQLNSISIPNFVNKNNLILGGEVYHLNKDLSTTLEKNIDRIEEVKNTFENFKVINKYTTDNNKIWKGY